MSTRVGGTGYRTHRGVQFGSAPNVVNETNGVCKYLTHAPFPLGLCVQPNGDALFATVVAVVGLNPRAAAAAEQSAFVVMISPMESHTVFEEEE